MRHMDVVTAYLYGDLDTEIHMKILEGFPLLKAQPRSTYSIQLRRSLYGVKQCGRMRYNLLSEYLSKRGYTNDHICSCLIIKKFLKEFAILAIYVDDINLIGTLEDLEETVDYLKKEFKMKDLGKMRFCLGLQIERSFNGMLVHQSNYIEKVLKRFGMDKAHPLSTPWSSGLLI